VMFLLPKECSKCYKVKSRKMIREKGSQREKCMLCVLCKKKGILFENRVEK